jgi:hypothetical protein
MAEIVVAVEADEEDTDISMDDQLVKRKMTKVERINSLPGALLLWMRNVARKPTKRRTQSAKRGTARKLTKRWTPIMENARTTRSYNTNTVLTLWDSGYNKVPRSRRGQDQDHRMYEDDAVEVDLY